MNDMTETRKLCAEHGPHDSWCGDPCVHDACNDAHPRLFGFYPAQRGSSQVWGEADSLELAREGAARAAARERVPYIVTDRYADVDGEIVEDEIEYVEVPS